MWVESGKRQDDILEIRFVLDDEHYLDPDTNQTMQSRNTIPLRPSNKRHHPSNRRAALLDVHKSSFQAVKYLVLSGGLGGSAYVKTQLETTYNSTSISIIRSQEPQLSVVKGLVMDRKQRILSGSATLTTRIARASYGVLCRQPYNPAIHVGADVEADAYKKKQKWAIKQIEWLIRKVRLPLSAFVKLERLRTKQGDTINTSTALEKTFTKKMDRPRSRLGYLSHIIQLSADDSALPQTSRRLRTLHPQDLARRSLSQNSSSRTAISGRGKGITWQPLPSVLLWRPQI